MVNHFERIKNIIYDESPKKAEEELKKAQKELKNNQIIELLIHIGASYWMHDNESARRVLNEALELKPKKDDEAEVYLYIARTLMAEDKNEEALILLNKALRLTRDRYLQGAILKEMSGCYYSIPDREKSIYYAYQSQKYRDPNNKDENYDYYDNMERIIENLLLMGEKGKADLIITECLNDKRIPKVAVSNIHYKMGNNYYTKQDWDNALINYEIALKYYDRLELSSKGAILKYLGSCFMHLGDYNRARLAYMQSLEYLLDNDDAEDKAFVKAELDIIRQNLGE